ncbi:MAG: sensor histidine kinase [Lachnospiraceae bacterium]|nr:sensor histidine kinase [Lachnospiraceae bacterium]
MVSMNDMTVKEMENIHGRRNRRFKNISIKYKIALVTGVAMLIPMVTLAILMLVFYNRAILERSNRQTEENIRIMSERIGTVVDNGAVCANHLTIELSSLFNTRDMRIVTRESKLLGTLNSAKIVYMGIDSIIFTDGEDSFITTDSSAKEHRDEVLNLIDKLNLKDNNGLPVLLDIDDAIDPDGKGTVTLTKRVFNVTSGSPIGYLFINIDRAKLVESAWSEISCYLLYDTTGNSIQGDYTESLLTDKEALDNIYKGRKNFIKYNGESWLIARTELESYGWTVIGITNLNRFNVTGREFMVIILISGGVGILLLIITVLATATLVTRPLTTLHDGAEKIAEGDMSVRFRFRTTDEIGRLGRIFNYMTQRNTELLAAVDEEAKKKREYELALIQEQVKPHFLYNTLDIIIMLIEMNRSAEAKRVTQKLANYYKNSLSGSEEIVTVERECEIAEDYLELQRMRYGDNLKFKIEMDEAVRKVSIPKMTFQPLVENAIYHGLKMKEGLGTISVIGRIVDEDAVIKISDTGMGMDEETLYKLTGRLKDRASAGDKKGHFGVYSADHRLKLYFGEEYGLSFESEYGKGTEVTIRIPYGR